MRVALALILVTTAVIACKEGKTTRVCAALEERLTACAGAGVLTPAALASAKDYCRVSLQYQGGSDDVPGNLAELTRDALTECSAARDCDALDVCLDRHGCHFFLTDPTDRTPSFSCQSPEQRQPP